MSVSLFKQNGVVKTLGLSFITRLHKQRQARLRLLSLCFLSIMLGMWTTNTFAQTVLINPSAEGGFNLGSTLAANGWTVANSTLGTAPVNEWVCGTAITTPPFSGSSAYISSDLGASNGYNVYSSTSVYFWRDVVIPVGENALTLSFDWVADGENFWDQIQVLNAPTTVTPTGELYPGSGNNVIGPSLLGSTYLGSFNLSPTIQTATVAFTATPGTTRRIIFAWKSDLSVGNMPGGSIDNISLISSNVFPTITATAAGGLWSSSATWVGGIVPTYHDVIVPSGSIVTIDQVTTMHSLNVSGIVQWNGTANTMNVSGDLTINAGGKFLPYTAVASPIFQLVEIAGNFTNNGYANCAFGTNTQGAISFSGLGSTLSGTGTFEGDGTRGIIKQLIFQNIGSNTINTSQDLTVMSLGHSAGSLNTNGKIRIDNTAQVYGRPINTQVSSVAVTAMGSAYNVAPVVFGTAVTSWTASGVATANSRYFNGNNVYLCTAGGTFGGAAPVNVTPVSEGNGTATLLWIGTTGTLGNPFQITSVSVNTLYFCGNNLYVCTVSGAPSAAAPPIHTSGTAVSGAATFLYIGSPAKVNVNYDPSSQTVRSLTLVSGGTGYTSAANPAIVFSLGAGGTTGSGATAFAVIMYAAFGQANSLMQRSGIATISGGLTINSDQGASIASVDPQASSGVGNIWTSNGGTNYTVAPNVAFGGPLTLNLITNPGSGYTVAPTITVTGGTLVAGIPYTSGSFVITVNQGTVQSVYLTATTAVYSVPPTLTLTASPGVTATLAFPAGCWPAATANLGTNGQISSFTITNSGYGYNAAPLVAVGGGTFTTAATSPSCRVALYNLRLNLFSPAIIPVTAPDDITIPPNRKMNNLSLAGNGIGLTLTAGSITLYGTSPLTLAASTNLPGNILDLNGNNLHFTWNAYNGLATSVFDDDGANTYVKNGSITLTGKGGSGSFNYPFAGKTISGSLVWMVGSTPTPVTTGCNATKFTVTELGAGTNTTPGDATPIGNRSYRAQFNAGAVSGLNPTITLHFNALDALTSPQDHTYVADAPAPSGPWTVRSTTYGSIGSLPAVGIKATATVAPGPIAATGDNYYSFALLTTSITSFTPANTCGGGTVVITGTSFNGTTAVTIGGAPALSFTVNSSTQITALVSNSASTGTIVVTSPSGTATSATNYTFDGVGPIVSIQEGSAIIICPAASTTLTALPAGGGQTYSWSPNAGNATTQTVSVNAAGTYTCTITNPGGCANTASTTITVNVPEVPTPTATPSTICQGSTSQLTAGTFGPAMLTTPFNHNSSTSFTGFDITNTSTVPVKLHYFSFLCAFSAGSQGLESIYYRPSAMNCIFPTPLGTDTNWVLIGTVNTTSMGNSSNIPTTIPLDANITIPPGATYAFAVGGDLGQYYTTGTSGCPILATTAHLTVREGFGGDLTFSYSDRRWNGTVSYDYGDPTLTYSWTPAGSLNNATLLNPVSSATSTTTYTVTATNTLGCSASANVTVNVNPVATADAGTNKTTCVSAPIMLTPVGIGTWTGGAGTFNGNEYTPNMSESGTTVTLTWTVAGAAPCPNVSDYVNVVIQAVPSAPTIMASNNNPCGNTQITLTATPAGGFTAVEYLWFKNGVAVNWGYSNTYTVNVGNVTTTNNYSVEIVYAGYNCTSNNSANTVVSVSAPTAIISPTGPTTFCNNTPTTLNATGGMSNYEWKRSVTTVQSGASSSYLPTGSGNHNVTVTGANGCTKTSTWMNIIVKAAPTANAGADKNLCEGSTIQIGAAGAAGNTYTWTPTTALSNAYISNPMASPSTTTAYTVTVNNATTGCSNTDAVNVNVLGLPSTPTISSAPSGNLVIISSTTPGAATINWYKNGLGLYVNMLPNSSISVYPSNPTNAYTVRSKGANGCLSNPSTPLNIRIGEEKGGVLIVGEMLMQAYPNPTSEVLNVDVVNSEIASGKLVLYNNLGQIIWQQELYLNTGMASTQIDMSPLAAGVYSLVFQNQQGNYIQKVIKE